MTTDSTAPRGQTPGPQNGQLSERERVLKQLAELPPNPPFEETVIEELTDDEARVFIETIMNA
jgi:hypothetical protein